MRRQDTKVCVRCKIEKPRSEFARDDSPLLAIRCRECRRELAESRENRTQRCTICKELLPVSAFKRHQHGNRAKRCSACQDKVLAYRSLSMADRFWPKVAIGDPDECWPWQAALFSDGYGVFGFGGKNYRAHRVAFFLEHGYWPELSCHTCDNPPCCNPAHLFDGTPLDNTRDMVAKGRGARVLGEDRPVAKLTEADIRDIRTRYAAGGETLESLAAEYGVTFQNIWHVVHRNTWKHVA